MGNEQSKKKKKKGAKEPEKKKPKAKRPPIESDRGVPRMTGSEIGVEGERKASLRQRLDKVKRKLVSAKTTMAQEQAENAKMVRVLERIQNRVTERKRYYHELLKLSSKAKR